MSDLIYLPHPHFNFETMPISASGRVGLLVSYHHGTLSMKAPPQVKVWSNLDYAEYSFASYAWKIDFNKLMSKFEKARSANFSSPLYPTYCFVREDGNEFAIRFFLKDNNINIRCWVRRTRPRLVNLIHEFKTWLEIECPLCF